MNIFFCDFIKTNRKGSNLILKSNASVFTLPLTTELCHDKCLSDFFALMFSPSSYAHTA